MNTSNDHVRQSLVMVREELERMRLAYLREARTSDESSMVNYYMAQSNAFFEAVVILDAAIVQAGIEDDERRARADEWPDDKTIHHHDRLRAKDFRIDPPPAKLDKVGRFFWGVIIISALAVLAGSVCWLLLGAKFLVGAVR